MEIDINVLSSVDLAERLFPLLLIHHPDKIAKYADETCVKMFEKCGIDEVLENPREIRCPVKNVRIANTQQYKTRIINDFKNAQDLLRTLDIHTIRFTYIVFETPDPLGTVEGEKTCIVAWPKYYSYVFLRSYVVSNLITQGWERADAEYIADRIVWIEFRLKNAAISQEIATNLRSKLEPIIERKYGRRPSEQAKKFCKELLECMS